MKRYKKELVSKLSHLEAEGAVEGINSRLGLESVRSRLSLLARRDGRLISVARAPELSADEAGDDVDVVRGPLAEVGRVSGRKGGLRASIETLRKDDGGIGAAAEVEGVVLAGLDGLAALDDAVALVLGGLEALRTEGPLAAGLGGGRGGAGLALSLLLATLAGAALKLAGVGGVGAGVVLHGTGTLQRGLEILEGGSVGLEGPVGVAAVNDLRRGAAEVAGKCLEVAAAGVLAGDDGAGLA